ncbi:MAG: MarR family transcriptional regulator [Leptolyngbyaceae cyanobacterium SU_3_3]|nr:MarR family transcriptional regulator [Leptolyngbyaceae cyanobacterium SU_3_3]
MDTGDMDTKPKLDDLRNSVWRLFLTAQVKLLDRIKARFSQAGLPPMEWYDVLLTLKEAPAYRVRLSELADQVLLSRSNLTRLVDRLEKAELLHREPCPSDRRGTFAVLTEAGLAMQQKMWTVYAEGITDFFGCHLDDEELKVMERVLKRMLVAVCE